MVNKLHLLLLSVLFGLILTGLGQSFAFSFPSTSVTGSEPLAQNLLGPFNINSTNLYAYAALFAAIVFFVLNYALKGTVLSGGSTAISLLFGVITFIFFLTNPALIGTLLNIGFLAFASILLLFFIFSRWSRTSPTRRILSLILLLVSAVLFLENYPPAANWLSSTLHFNVLPFLLFAMDAGIILSIIYALIRAMARSRNLGVKMLLVFLLIFFSSMFIPGFVFVLFTPLVLGLLAVAFIIVVFLIWRVGRYTPQFDMETPERSQGKKFAHNRLSNQKALPAPKGLKALPYISEKEAKGRGIRVLRGRGEKVLPSDHTIALPQSKEVSSPPQQPSGKEAKSGPTSAYDRRLKPPLWFTPKSPVDKDLKLDPNTQNDLEVQGLSHRREELVNSINSGVLSSKELKNARNELRRIDYTIKRYNRYIHR